MVKRIIVLFVLIAALTLSAPASADGPNDNASLLGTCSSFLGQEGMRDDIGRVIKEFPGPPGKIVSDIAQIHGDIPLGDCVLEPIY